MKYSLPFFCVCLNTLDFHSLAFSCPFKAYLSWSSSNVPFLLKQPPIKMYLPNLLIFVFQNTAFLLFCNAERVYLVLELFVHSSYICSRNIPVKHDLWHTHLTRYCFLCMFHLFFFCNEKICLLHNVLGNSHKNKNAGPLLEVLDKGINQFLLEQA